MKKKDLQETRSKDLQKLKDEADGKRLTISKASVEIKGSKEKNLKKVKNLRKDLAQTLTVIREKEIIENKNLGKEEQK